VRATGSLHSTLVAPTVGGASGTCAPDLGQRGAFFDPRLVRGRYVRSFGATASTRIGFGPLPPWATIDASTRRDGGTIGYVAIPSFAGAGWGGEIDDAVATLEARSRAEAPSAPGLGALIIDVRGNGGGDEATARAVAARFVDQERVYALRRFRDGPARGALGPPAEARVAPAGRRFAGRVVVLTDRGTASAAEDFVLMMRVVPGAVVVGDTTSGTASQPLPRQLPNGWWLRVPASMELTPDGAFVVEGRGLPPDVAAPSALADVERVLVRARDGAVVELVIDSVRSTPKEVLVGFEGVESRTAAEKLVGSTVLVYREDLDAPEDGEFFQGDLVGLLAVDESGAELGTVEEIWQTGPVPNLVIRAEGKPELVVPFADEFVPSVEMEQGRIVIRPPEYTE